MVRNSTPEVQLTINPDRYIMLVENMSADQARQISLSAVRQARQMAPKLTGGGARSIQPIWGQGYFGVTMTAKHMWYQERGMSPFTMRSLEGRTVPMWIDDPTGSERRKNPKAKTRVTASGKAQVLIFRKVGKRDQPRQVRKRSKSTGEYQTTMAPSHYPGAPGRIAHRESPRPLTSPGKQGGQIAPGNVGVWWRHPGLSPRLFLNHSMTKAAERYGVLPVKIYVADAGWRSRI